MSTAVDTAKPQSKPDVQPPKSWNVVLLDDDDHTYEYVMELARKLFGASEQAAFVIACTVDNTGRAVLTTTHKELAELKQEQVHAFGADPRLPRSKGAMTALLEPAV
ncbi:MAG: ATP-dependent Clp protease adaptor ClpS [Phycisphaerales bacterium]